MKYGKTLGINFWDAGEPNDDGGDEDCVEIRGDDKGGKWNDMPCSNKLRYICGQNKETNTRMGWNTVNTQIKKIKGINWTAIGGAFTGIAVVILSIIGILFCN